MEEVQEKEKLAMGTYMVTSLMNEIIIHIFPSKSLAWVLPFHLTPPSWFILSQHPNKNDGKAIFQNPHYANFMSKGHLEKAILN
jgi:hypothetical protein